MGFRRWLPHAAIAVAAHVAALAAMRLAPPRHDATASESPASDLRDLEVELDAPVPALEPPDEATVAATPALRPRTATGPQALAMRETGTVPPAAPDASGTGLEPAPAPADSGWTFHAASAPDVLAAGAVARAVQDTVPPVPAPTTVSPTGGLAEGLDARDATLGLGRGGPVTSALEAATYADYDAEGKATFDVSIDSSGHVAVSLLDASAASGAWAHVAQAMRASLSSAPVRVPPGAKGWHVVATVESKIQYPNGADPKKMGTSLEADAPALAENKHRADIGDPPIVFKKMPGITLAHSGKVCSVRIHLGLGPPISGGCDPSNIGAHTTRVVRSHVVSEGRL
jgi:hypothetical protein